MDNEISFALDQIVGGLGPVIFESIKVPFGIFEPSFKVVWANNALAALYKVSQETLIGNICYKTGYKRDEPCPDCHVQAVIQTGKTRIVEKFYEFDDGMSRWGEIHAYPVRGKSGNIASIIVFGFDITEKKKRLQKLSEYSKSLSDKLNADIDQKEIQYSGTDITIKVNLSNRQSEILRLITEGYTNVQISELLSISANTVKTHVNSIFNKLGVNDRTNAAVLAARQNFV